MRKEVIKLDNIKLASVNKKYVSRKFILNKNYADLKSILTLSCKKVDLKPPYRVDIYLETYLDIDNPIKLILDSLSNAITDDREVVQLSVEKKKILRGKAGKLIVWVEEIN